jgi:hypothetical protein
VEQSVAAVAPLCGHWGSAEWEAFDLSDDLIFEHEVIVTDRRDRVLVLDLSEQG